MKNVTRKLNRIIYLVLSIILFVSCETNRKKDKKIINPTSITIKDLSPHKTALTLDVNFNDFGEVNFNRENIQWNKIDTDSLMSFNLSFNNILLESFKFNRSVIASRIPINFNLQKKKKITLSINYLFNKVYTDSLIFVKKNDSYKLDKIYTIFYGKADGNWICPSNYTKEIHTITLNDNDFDNKKCKKIK